MILSDSNLSDIFLILNTFISSLKSTTAILYLGFVLTLAMVSMRVYANQTFDVMAIEYPPFTTAKGDQGGLAFKRLNQLFETNQVTWSPDIVPAARAYKRIEVGDWCASFYPAFGDSSFRQVTLTRSPINIALVRQKESQPFSWKALNELKGKTVALLRTGRESQFAARFTHAGLEVYFVETVVKGYQMVLRDRVDFAMIDNVTFDALAPVVASQLQLSDTHLLSTPITLFIKDQCLPDKVDKQLRQLNP